MQEIAEELYEHSLRCIGTRRYRKARAMWEAAKEELRILRGVVDGEKRQRQAEFLSRLLDTDSYLTLLAAQDLRQAKIRHLERVQAGHDRKVLEKPKFFASRDPNESFSQWMRRLRR